MAKSERLFVVKLEDGVWLADWDGDPGRTTQLEHAKLFKYLSYAVRSLEDARKFRPFKNAKVMRFDVAWDQEGK